MPDPIDSANFDDPLTPDELADPGALAMHGLLSVHFEIESGADPSRVDEVLAAIERESAPRSFPLRRWARRVGWGLAVAAAVALVLMLREPPSVLSPALANQLRQFGFEPALPLTDMLVDPNDPEDVRATLTGIETARIRRDEMRAAGETGEMMFAWMNEYRNVRALGRFDEAIAEMEAALAFCREEHQRRIDAGEGGFSYLYSVLTDLGNTYAALGEFDRAREFHQESLDLATAFEDWNFTVGSGKEKADSVVAHSRANTLAPRFWIMARLEESASDLPAARTWLDGAEELFRDALIHECQARGIAIPTEYNQSNQSVERKRPDQTNQSRERKLADKDKQSRARKEAEKTPANQSVERKRHDSPNPSRARKEADETSDNQTREHERENQTNESVERERPDSPNPSRARKEADDATRQPPPHNRDSVQDDFFHASPAPTLAHLAIELSKLHDPALTSLITKTREHLLREAEWSRLSKNADTAWEILRLAQTIPYDEFRDESKLPFAESMETLRTAIAKGDFTAALEAAADAQQALAGQAFPAERGLTRPPVGVFQRAELRFLRGTVQAALNHADPEARRLIVSALAVIDDAPVPLSPLERGHFWIPINKWRSVRDQLK